MQKLKKQLILKELTFRERLSSLAKRTGQILSDKSGNEWVDQGLVITIGAVLAILVMGALIYIFKNQIITGLKTVFTNLFSNQNGSLT